MYKGKWIVILYLACWHYAKDSNTCTRHQFCLILKSPTFWAFLSTLACVFTLVCFIFELERLTNGEQKTSHFNHLRVHLYTMIWFNVMVVTIMFLSVILFMRINLASCGYHFNDFVQCWLHFSRHKLQQKTSSCRNHLSGSLWITYCLYDFVRLRVEFCIL